MIVECRSDYCTYDYCRTDYCRSDYCRTDYYRSNYCRDDYYRSDYYRFDYYRSDYDRFHGVIVFIFIFCIDLYDFIRGVLQFDQKTNINAQLNAQEIGRFPSSRKPF